MVFFKSTPFIFLQLFLQILIFFFFLQPKLDLQLTTSLRCSFPLFPFPFPFPSFFLPSLFLFFFLVSWFYISFSQSPYVFWKLKFDFLIFPFFVIDFFFPTIDFTWPFSFSFFCVGGLLVSLKTDHKQTNKNQERRQKEQGSSNGLLIPNISRREENLHLHFTLRRKLDIKDRLRSRRRASEINKALADQLPLPSKASHLQQVEAADVFWNNFWFNVPWSGVWPESVLAG